MTVLEVNTLHSIASKYIKQKHRIMGRSGHIPVAEGDTHTALRDSQRYSVRKLPARGVFRVEDSGTVRQSPGCHSQWGSTSLPVCRSPFGDSPCPGGCIPSLWVQRSRGRHTHMWPPGDDVSWEGPFSPAVWILVRAPPTRAQRPE